MTYFLGPRSQHNLSGVNRDLIEVATLSISHSSVDFAVIQGLRTAEQQEEYFLAGKSQKRTGGKHQIGHAIDTMANVGDLDGDGDTDENWDEANYYKIASSFQAASRTLKIPLIWGCVWDRILSEMSDDLIAEVRARKQRMNGKCFLDWGHFELHYSTASTT